MGFALCPDNGPPRLWRFVDNPAMTNDKVVAMLVPEKNLLIVNRELFDRLSDIDKHMTLRTHARLTYAY